MQFDPERVADWLVTEHTRGAPLVPFARDHGATDLAAAYAIQDAFVQRMTGPLGDKAGYKIGLTSTRMQKLCAIDHPVAGVVFRERVLASGLRVVVADPRTNEDSLRATFESAGRAAVHQMERYLNTLGTIASSAPLLGLLGTVIGMIEIFGSQAPTGGNNPALLAHGISIALYNTAFGLIVAIPALMFYRYFRGRVDAYTIDLEQAADRMLPHLMRFVQTAGSPGAAPAARRR